MKPSVIALISVLACGSALGADTKGPVISGTLYFVAPDGKEVPPSPPSRVHIGYWEGHDLRASFMGKSEGGRIVLVSTLGTASVNADGTFRVTLTREGLPPGVVLVGLQYRDAGNGAATLSSKSGEAFKIDISKVTAQVALGRIRLE